MKSDEGKTDWQCHGWEDNDRAQLLDGAAMTFHERLLWLQDADRMVRCLETKRRWIDKDGVIHERVTMAAETPGAYEQSPGGDPSG